MRQLLLSWLLAVLPALAQNGDYLGTVQIGIVKLRLALHVIKDPATGTFKATVDSLDQGARGLPIDLTIDGKNVRFSGRNGMTYEGTFTDDAQTAIQGSMSQNGQAFPLNFAKVDKIEGPKRPQTPQRPFAYTEEEVTVRNGDVTLGGTLSLPKGAGPLPTAIFLTGSGAQDRDETLFEHKPFLVISDVLVKMGVATLRLDDRGVGKSTGNLARSTLDDLTNDAVAAMQFLKSRTEVDPKKIGFIGHSEGGITGPMAAAKAGDAAFVIMLAGVGVPGDDVLREQGQAALRATGAAQQVLDFQLAYHNKFLPIVKSETDPEKLRVKLDEALEQFKTENPIAKMAEAQLKTQMPQLLMPSMQSFIRSNPGPVLAQVKCPLLALNGSLDTQVLAYQNLPAIAAALARNPDITIVSIPGLNHLFQPAKTGAVMEYSQIEETISPRVLELIAQWLKARI